MTGARAMETADLRSIALQQRLRGVAVVELAQGAQRVRIVMPVHDAAPPAVAGEGACAHGCASATTVAPAVAEPGTRVVKAEALGLLRLTHPDVGGPPLRAGDAVAQGACLALLQVGELLTPVTAPCAGTVRQVLAADGERIDYGRPLFELATGR